MNQKILGSILGAAVGDAMGAATETKSARQIQKIFGGRVEEFKTPPEDVLARGRKAGQVTDAFSIPYILTEHLIDEKGQASKKLGEEALIEWGKTEYFESYKVLFGTSEKHFFAFLYLFHKENGDFQKRVIKKHKERKVK